MAPRPRRWRDLRALYGRTIGILGMGHTGVELAARAKAFNMRVLGYRRRDMAPPPGVERMWSADKGETIDDILREADVLALVLNLSDATHHLIGAREIAMMKPSAIIVNLARGGIVDTDAMVAALEKGRLAGAGLDVTDPEPLPPGHPLWDAPNVLITPHFTAAVPDKIDRSLDVITENLRRWRDGEPMLNRMTEEDIWTAAGPWTGRLSHARLRRPPAPLHDPDAHRDLDRLLHPDPAAPRGLRHLARGADVADGRHHRPEHPRDAARPVRPR